MSINVSNDFKLRTKKIKQQDIKLTILEEAIAQEIQLANNLVYYNTPVRILKEENRAIAKQVIYSFEAKLFKTVMRQIEITVKNVSVVKNKNINFKYGLLVNNSFEYIDLGDFYIKDVEDDKNKEELVVTGYDKMLNFMRLFKQSELKLTWPCSVGLLVERMCKICGVDPYSLNFYNNALLVDEDFFTTQEITYRDVLEKITQATLTTAFIKENKLYLCKISDNAIDSLDTSYLSNLVINEKFGPVNALVLGRGQVEDNIEERDDKSIQQNGRCEIRFDENEIIEYKREQIIADMFEQIKGLEYYSYEGADIGVMWLEPCDRLLLKDRENNEYSSLYMRAHITINTGIHNDDIGADLLEETDTEYKVTTKEQKKTMQVERLAKKNEGLIQDLAKETSEHEEKLTEVLQDLDGIKQQVSNAIDYKREVEGFTEIYLENAGQADILKFEIKGNKTYESNLFPRTGLQPRIRLQPNQRGG
ncbi:MAG: hypothetical protein HFJ52_00100 [Clostridia bacterium]|nr:hypothetical protein [Clostridia bacterium]